MSGSEMRIGVDLGGTKIEAVVLGDEGEVIIRRRRETPAESYADTLQAVVDLVAELEKLPAGASAEDIQTQVYEVGKRHDFEGLRDWFKACYEILLGQDQGPRLGSFIALYGVDETLALIRRALAGENLGA